MVRPLSGDARAKMLDAARAILLADGLDGCTIDEVARRSGVAKTTIYRHFGHADELALAALDAMVADLVPPDSGSLRDDLRAVVLTFRTTVKSPSFRKLFVSLLDRSLDDPRFAEVYRNAQEMRRAPLRLAIQRAIARGEVDPSIDIEQAVYFVQGPFVAKRLVDQEEVTERDIDVFIDLAVRALRPS